MASLSRAQRGAVGGRGGYGDRTDVAQGDGAAPLPGRREQRELRQLAAGLVVGARGGFVDFAAGAGLGQMMRALSRQ
jgi:hypothetical protein